MASQGLLQVVDVLTKKTEAPSERGLSYPERDIPGLAYSNLRITTPNTPRLNICVQNLKSVHPFFGEKLPPSSSPYERSTKEKDAGNLLLSVRILLDK